MALLTTHSNANRVVISGKTKRITTSPIGDPTITVSKQSDGSYKVDTVQWYQAIGYFSASYAYVGMTYDAAQSCAEAMRTKFTRPKQIWEYKAVENPPKTFKFEWVSTGQGTVLEAEISVEPMGGCMYQTVIQCSCRDEKFVKDPSSVSMDFPSCFNDVP